jgi:DNA adenine methylase
MTAPTRPVLRYHGGKWRIAPWIIGHFPPHRTYVEPYGGAASVLMQKSRVSCEVYNDLDEEVVNVFTILRDPDRARELARLVSLTPFSRIEHVRAYEASKDSLERARRMIVRSMMAHGTDATTRRSNPGFRSKRTGDASHAQDFSNYPQHIRSFVSRLRSVVIECLPAVKVIERYDSDQTLHYVDPPYVSSTRTASAQPGRGYRFEMTDSDHKSLAARLHSITGMVVLSGYDSPLYRRLYPDWPVFRRKVMADKAVPREECLWLSPRTAAKLNRRSTLMELAG